MKPFYSKEKVIYGMWISRDIYCFSFIVALAFDFGLNFGQDETPSEDPWYQSLLGEFYQSIPENRQQPAIDFAGKNVSVLHFR